MALALSLSLDLFLMKGSLLIAVRAQSAGRTDGRKEGRTDRRREGRATEWRKGRRGEEIKGGGEKQEEGTEQRDVVNVVTQRVGGEMHWPPQHSTGNNVSDMTVTVIQSGSSLLLTHLHFEIKVSFGQRRSSSEALQ